MKMIIPYEPMSKIQVLLSARHIRNTTKEQMIKDLLLKGWCYDSAVDIAKAIKQTGEYLK